MPAMTLPRDGIAGSYDAIVIGSGAGGGTVACRLAQRGLKVLVAERGERLRPHPDAGPDRVGRFLYHEVADPTQPLSLVGGQTKFYGAALYRLRESDFEEVAHERGVSPAWPIRYAEIEPYYEAAERLYQVHGCSEGDPTEPPRARPYPYPPLPQDPLMRRIAGRLQASGTSTAPIPRGLDHGPGGRCVMCATCDAHYCQLDAKMDAETAALAQATATGNLRLVSGVECLRVLTDQAGSRACGVVLRDADGEHVVSCSVVVSSAGLQGSPLLLRRSRTDQHPHGLGNNGGSLGRYLAGHAVGMAFPIISLRELPPTHTKDFAINAYYHGAPDWRYPLGVIQTGGQTPFWMLTRKPYRPLVKWVGMRAITCFYMGEVLPSRESGLRFDGDGIADNVLPTYNMASFWKLRAIAVEAFARAGYRTLTRRRPPYLWHETGTARMGDDPATSVVDRNCQVHGISGLYVMDASVLPTAGAVNTGLTIMALALRAGDHIARHAVADSSRPSAIRAPSPRTEAVAHTA